MMLLLASAFAAVTSGTHDGTVVGDTIEWTSNLHVDSFTCIPLAPGDTSPKRLGDQACHHETIEVHRSEPLDGPLHPPTTPRGLHRIGISGRHLVPDASMGLEKTVTGWTHPSIGRGERLRFDTRRGHRRKRMDRYVYLRSPTHPLHAELLDSSVRPGSQAMMGGGFGLLLLAGVFGYRRLDRMARRERVDAWFADRDVAQELKDDGIR